jgi:hypothetical protein
VNILTSISGTASYDYFQQNELGRERIEIILKEDEESGAKLEFRFGSYTHESDLLNLRILWCL